MAGTDLTFGSLTLCGGDPVDQAFYEVREERLGEAGKIWYSMAHTAGMRFKVVGLENTPETLPVTVVEAITTFASAAAWDAWLTAVQAAMSNPYTLIQTLGYATPRYTGPQTWRYYMTMVDFRLTDPFRTATYSAFKNKWELSWTAAFMPAEG